MTIKSRNAAVFVAGATLLGAAVVLIIVLRGCDSSVGFPSLDGRTYYVSKHGCFGRVRCGLVDGELDYVIFEVAKGAHPQNIDKELIIRIGKRRGGVATAQWGKDTSRAFGVSSNLFEYRNGEYFDKKYPVTVQDLEAYLASNPSEYGIDAFIKFVKW